MVGLVGYIIYIYIHTCVQTTSSQLYCVLSWRVVEVWKEPGVACGCLPLMVQPCHTFDVVLSPSKEVMGFSGGSHSLWDAGGMVWTWCLFTHQHVTHHIAATSVCACRPTTDYCSWTVTVGDCRGMREVVPRYESL